MGHTRLGTIPTTKKWQTIVSSFSTHNNSDVSENFLTMSNRILVTTSDYLQSAIDDPGFIETFYTLTKVVETSRRDNWSQELESIGIKLKSDSSLMDLIAESQNYISTSILENGRSSDVSEMCLSALGKTISELASPFTNSLFEENLDTVQDGIRKFSTKAGFSNLGQAFFGNFLSKFVGFYTSRILADVAGEENSKIQDISDIIRFDRDFGRHCMQSAFIVHDFAGEWYSKNKYFENLDVEHTKGFLAIVVKKLRAELKKQIAEQK